MSVTVTSPTANQTDFNVVAAPGNRGSICACGTAQSPAVVAIPTKPDNVFGKIYDGVVGPGSAGVPASPPPGDPSVVTAAVVGGNWNLPQVPGAQCGASPGAQSTLVIWAVFASAGTERAFQPFQGVCANATNCNCANNGGGTNVATGTAKKGALTHA
jgi:hypothetical protein